MPLISQDLDRLFLCFLIYPIHASRYIFHPSLARDTIFLTLITLIIYRISTTTSTSASATVAVSAQNSNFFITFANFLLISPEQTRHRTSDRIHINKELSRWKRFKWGLSYVSAPRGVGWNWTVPGTPAPLFESRMPFLLRAVVRYVKWYIVLDAINHYKSTQPFWATHGMALGYGSSGVGSFSTKVIHGGVVMASEYAGLQMVYTMLGFVTVLVGFYQSKDFPPIFGSIADAYTLRRFWGRFWHQVLRDVFAIYSSAFLRILPVKSDTTTYHRLQLYTTFLISSIVHFVMVFPLRFSNGIPSGKNTSYVGTDQFAFFMLQAIGIHIEDLVLQRKELEGVWKAIGHLWVAVWFAYTAPFLTDELTIGGLDAESKGLPFSIVGLLMVGGHNLARLIRE